MLKVYIADDEEVVRQGLKKIINWRELGFEICGEAGNGLTAYNEIAELNPHLIVVDIRMPKMQGLDLASRLRKDGYEGRLIVLSGYSEFKYAQQAIRCDVDFYLTKPIDEDELYNAVLEIKDKIQKKKKSTQHLNFFQEKATDKIMEDIIKGENKDFSNAKFTLEDLDLTDKQFQVLMIKSNEEGIDAYAALCADLKAPLTTGMMKKIKIDNNIVVLMKGELIIRLFASYLDSNKEDDDNSFFIAAGVPVDTVEKIPDSYYDALAVYEHQFFFQVNKHICHKDDLPPSDTLTNSFTAQSSKELGQQLYDLIVVFKKSECEAFLGNLKSQIAHSKNSAESIKSVLAGMYIFVIQEFKRAYANYKPEFLTNAEIIQWFHSCSYLQELLDFIQIEAQRLIQIIGGYSSESIVDEIVEFMKYHYDEDIKLKNIAPKFGYNSSYLGKIFSKKMDASFNDYLHKIRAEKAKKLLLNKKYKIYEISSLVGYKNVDYFHLKFKQFEGCTPNEYRIANRIEAE